MAKLDYLKDQDEISIDSRYRAAFPAYKVYVYGKDISGDVETVRINQSGGSLERMPSTCTITLANYREKYTLTHANMLVIGERKKNVLAKSGDKYAKTDSGAYLRNVYNEQGMGFEYANPYLGNTDIETTTNLSGKVRTYLSDVDPTKLDELTRRMAEASDDEITYMLEAEGFQIESVDQARALTAAITTAKIGNTSQLMDFGTDNFVLGDLGEDDLNYSIKDEVVTDKLTYTQEMKLNSKLANIAKGIRQQTGLLFDYPMQEGDCIFNLNDPVRVAFRDPFDPRIWYWSFTGFIDAWTEDIAADLASSIIISCTDITKMARYTLSNVRAGVVDCNIEPVLKDLGQDGYEQAEIRLTQELFADLRISEILELNFFGSKSAINLANVSRIDKEGVFGISAAAAFNDQFGRENAKVEEERESMQAYLQEYGITQQEIQSIIYREADVPNTYDEIKSRFKDALDQLSIHTVKSITTNLGKLGFQGISSPRDIPFKRRNDRFGIHYFVYGELDAMDKASGGTQIDSFHSWNEVLHHRVRREDLEVMAMVGEGKNAKSSNQQEVVTKAYADSVNWTSDQIIDAIGTNLNLYPVGHGRVFYLAPARMYVHDRTGVMDRVFGGVGNFHSVFKDRLSMLYDVAQTIEWRFYATPKGDVVFEHPLYDHDPEEFFEPKPLSNIAPPHADANMSTYEEAFQAEYSGAYYTDGVTDLTDFVFSLNTEDSSLIDFRMQTTSYDYESQFTVGIDEQLGFSNTNSDRGLLTAYRVQPHNVKGFTTANNDAARQFVFATDKTLVPTLGFRMMDGAVESFVSTNEGGMLFSALKLRQINSEARNLSLDTIPKFGLMVNRPLKWLYRNYCANIVSCSHSIAWNNNVSTSISLNQMRAWSGLIDKSTNKPIFNHFGDGNKSFNWADLMSRAAASSYPSKATHDSADNGPDNEDKKNNRNE